MTDPQRIDFKQIIAELEAAGVSIYKISAMCGRGFNTVKHWKDGGQPRHFEGQILLAIHAEYAAIPARATAKI